jgi:hypothetical protein
VKIGRRSSGVMVTGGDDKRVNMWAIGKPHALLVRPRSNRCAQALTHARRAMGLRFGRARATGGVSWRALRALKAAADVAAAPQSLAGHQSGVECVAFDSTEEAVVAGAAGGTLKMFDIAAGKGATRSGAPARRALALTKLWRCAPVVRTLTGHRAACVTVDFHPYGAPERASSAVRRRTERQKHCATFAMAVAEYASRQSARRVLRLGLAGHVLEDLGRAPPRLRADVPQPRARRVARRLQPGRTMGCLGRTRRRRQGTPLLRCVMCSGSSLTRADVIAPFTTNQLWDLTAAKVLVEFAPHAAAVSAVECVHPHADARCVRADTSSSPAASTRMSSSSPPPPPTAPPACGT